MYAMKKTTVKKEKSNKLSMILSFILTLTIGCLLLVATDDFLVTVNYAIVCVFAIIGVIQVLNFLLSKDYEQEYYTNIIMGTIFLWLALFLYTYYSMLVAILPIIISLYAFILGTISLIKYFSSPKPKIKAYLIISIISYLIGVILILEPWYSVKLYLKIMGTYVVISAFTYLFNYLQLKKPISDKNTINIDEKNKK